MKKGAGQGKVALRQRRVGAARPGSPVEALVKSLRPRRSVGKAEDERLHSVPLASPRFAPPRRPRRHPVVDMCHCAQISAALIHLLGCLAAGSSATPQIIRRHLAFFNCRRRLSLSLSLSKPPPPHTHTRATTTTIPRCGTALDYACYIRVNMWTGSCQPDMPRALRTATSPYTRTQLPPAPPRHETNPVSLFFAMSLFFVTAAINDITGVDTGAW